MGPLLRRFHQRLLEERRHGEAVTERCAGSTTLLRISEVRCHLSVSLAADSSPQGEPYRRNNPDRSMGGMVMAKIGIFA